MFTTEDRIDYLKRTFRIANRYIPQYHGEWTRWERECPYRKEYDYIVCDHVDMFGKLYFGDPVISPFKFVRMPKEAKRFGHLEAYALVMNDYVIDELKATSKRRNKEIAIIRNAQQRANTLRVAESLISGARVAANNGRFDTCIRVDDGEVDVKLLKKIMTKQYHFNCSHSSIISNWFTISWE